MFHWSLRRVGGSNILIETSREIERRYAPRLQTTSAAKTRITSRALQTKRLSLQLKHEASYFYQARKGMLNIEGMLLPEVNRKGAHLKATYSWGRLSIYGDVSKVGACQVPGPGGL